MNNKKIQFNIITPLGIIFSKEVKVVNLPTENGFVTILPNHAPLIGSVHYGECKTTLLDDSIESFAIFDGVVEVKDGNESTEVTLLLDRSENSKDIDINRAEEALKRAEDLKNQVHDEDIDFARFETLIDKELNRIKIGKKYK